MANETKRRCMALRIAVAVLIIGGVLAALTIPSVMIAGSVMGVNEDTVLCSVKSPDGRYVAEYIGRDSGALGYDTFVQVRNVGGVIARIIAKPRRIFTGTVEHTDSIKWVSDSRLSVDGIEYEIEKGK